MEDNRLLLFGKPHNRPPELPVHERTIDNQQTRQQAHHERDRQACERHRHNKDGQRKDHFPDHKVRHGLERVLVLDRRIQVQRPFAPQVAPPDPAPVPGRCAVGGRRRRRMCWRRRNRLWDGHKYLFDRVWVLGSHLGVHQMGRHGQIDPRQRAPGSNRGHGEKVPHGRDNHGHTSNDQRDNRPDETEHGPGQQHHHRVEQADPDTALAHNAPVRGGLFLIVARSVASGTGVGLTVRAQEPVDRAEVVAVIFRSKRGLPMQSRVALRVR